MQPSDEPAEREPKLARRSPFAPSTKLCPKCLGPLKGMNGLGGWLIPQNYFCARCGYTGIVFVEKEAGSEKEKS